jgi:hypothetical protein
MYKLLFLLSMLFASTLFGQIQYIDTTATGDETKEYVSTKDGKYLPVTIKDASIMIDSVIVSPNVSIVGNGTFLYAANAITAAEVLGGDVTCKKVTITNFTVGEVIYVGGNASVTTSNGFPLWYGDSYTMTVSNLNKVFLISDGTSVDIRYTYEN